MDSNNDNNRRPTVWPLLMLLAAFASACRDPEIGPEEAGVRAPADSPDWLVDISAEAGLDFVHESGLDGSFSLPQIVGSGGALFDYDDDGDLDVYLVRTGPNALFRQEPGGRFVEVGAASGLDDRGFGMGTALGDYDNDGDLDLLVSNFGPNRLYRNNGDGTFSDVSEPAGIVDDAWSTSAAFFDYDRDGWLDLYIANYLEYVPEKTCRDQSGRLEYCGPQAFAGTPDLLYRNDGDGGFTDVGRQAGTHSTAGKGLGVVTADFNDDGWQDVFVANDGVANQLWINSGRGRFEDRAYAMGVAVNGFGKPEASMGVALGDVDGNLGLDLFLTHLDRETNTMYTQVAPASYQDATAISRLGVGSLPRTGFGTGFFDLENDGDLDLMIVNGRVARAAAPGPAGTGPLAAYAEPNALELNLGDGRFADHCAAARTYCSAREVSRSLMFGDVDADGDLDALITNSNAPARLYRNDAPDMGNWLAIRVLDARYRRDAVGSRVYILAGDTWMVRPVTHTYSYLASTDATTHFGLGQAVGAERIVVRWPDQTYESFPPVAAGRSIVVTRGRGEPAQPPSLAR